MMEAFHCPFCNKDCSNSPYGEMNWHLEKHCIRDERIEHIKEYLDVMKDEPADSLIEVKKVYHDLKRIIDG